MSSCVVDTDVVSYVSRDSPEAQPYREHLVGKLLVISFATLAEIRYGMLLAGWSTRRKAGMEAYLGQYVLYWCDSELCTTWAQVVHSERLMGRVINAQDAWIAATAIRHNIPLITHNRRHFQNVEGLQIVSES